MRKPARVGLTTLAIATAATVVSLTVTGASAGAERSLATAPIRTQIAELKGSDTVVGDEFGSSVAISGTTAVVGAYGHAHGTGRAYVFTKTGARWKQVAELKGSDTAGDSFGYSVAISGTTAVVGAFNSVYVFTKTGARWKQVAELKGSDTAAHSFGSSVAISGTTAVVGALAQANGAGRAYVFTKSAARWRQTAELKGSDTVAGDQFGSSVAISGTTAVVGALAQANRAGRAYVFSKSATGWRQIAELQGPDAVAGDYFAVRAAIWAQRP